MTLCALNCGFVVYKVGGAAVCSPLSADRHKILAFLALYGHTWPIGMTPDICMLFVAITKARAAPDDWTTTENNSVRIWILIMKKTLIVAAVAALAPL